MASEGKAPFRLLQYVRARQTLKIEASAEPRGRFLSFSKRFGIDAFVSDGYLRKGVTV